jgi:hypothetical protein
VQAIQSLPAAISAATAIHMRRCGNIKPRLKGGMSRAEVGAALDDWIARVVKCLRGI